MMRTQDERRLDLRSAVRVEYVTVAWMATEFASSTALGLLSGSLLLVAFGVDSLIELLSAVLVLRRFRLEMSGATDWEKVEQAERRTARWTGYLLFALAAYVVASSAYALIAGHKVETSISTWGLIVAVAAVAGMPVLAWYKRKLAAPGRLDSASLRADAAEATSCAYLAGVLLVGLVLTRALGVWWIDAVAALALVPFIVVEGREAFESNADED